jgi:hypothetical protein
MKENSKDVAEFVATQQMPTVGKDKLYSFNDAAELLGIRRTQLRRAIVFKHIIPEVNQDLDSRFSKKAVQDYARKWVPLAPCLSAVLETEFT